MLARDWGIFSALALLSLYQATRTGKNRFIKRTNTIINRVIRRVSRYGNRANTIIKRVIKRVSRYIDHCPRMVQSFRWRMIMPGLARAYGLAVSHLGWWPIRWFSRKNRWKRKGPQRIAYFIWQFPKLSETFIQREVEALKRSGVHLEVLSESPVNRDYFDAQARDLMADTHYLMPFCPKRLARYAVFFFFTHPLRFANLFLYVLFHHYGGRKTPMEDLHVFGLAVYLAGVLREKNVNHLHSPWAIKTAFVCLVAARLLQIPYTVQARASVDIHRKVSRYGLSEKLDNADRVITNTLYNKKVLQSLMKKRNWNKIHVIYNGLNPEQFKPAPRVPDISQGITFLSVARLIEPKGLDYLHSVRSYSNISKLTSSYSHQ